MAEDKVFRMFHLPYWGDLSIPLICKESGGRSFKKILFIFAEDI